MLGLPGLKCLTLITYCNSINNSSYSNISFNEIYKFGETFRHICVISSSSFSYCVQLFHFDSQKMWRTYLFLSSLCFHCFFPNPTYFSSVKTGLPAFQLFIYGLSCKHHFDGILLIKGQHLLNDVSVIYTLLTSVM